MTSRFISRQRKQFRSLSMPLVLKSARFRSRLFRLLPVVTKLITLVGFISLAATFHAQLTRAQTDNLPSSNLAYNLTSKSEIIELRSAYANHYDLGDDRRLAFVGADPINYQDSNGSWQPIKPEFVEVENGWRVTQNTLRSAFADDNTIFQIESGGYGFIWQPIALEINDNSGRAWQLATPQPGSEVQVDAQESLLRYANAWSDPTILEQFRSAADSLEQELVLANPPAAVSEGEWLSLSVDLSLPGGILLLADGEVQTGEFTTYGALQFQGADGTTLLTLLPPRAYEEKDPLVATGGRYRVMPQPNGLTLWVQTPLDWWLASERSYPAVLDPTMQVLRPLEVATIGYPYDSLDLNAGVINEYACVGFHDNHGGPITFVGNRWFDRGYVKFKLPNLPDGAVADQAILVAAPEPSKLTAVWSAGGSYEDTLVYRVTQDWSFLDGLTTVPATTVIAQAPTETDRAQIPYVFSSEFDPAKRPVTQWDVTSDVQEWYQNPTSNYGFALVSEFEGHHLDDQPMGQNPINFYLNCFPKTSMGILDDVLANPSTPTVGEPGIGLLIEYTSPQLAANELRTVRVPSAYPGDTYENQQHEYITPATSGWQLMAARGVRGEKPPQTRLQLTQVVPTDPDLDELISNNAVLENETIQFYSEYVVANGYQSLPTDLRLHVLEDTFATELTDDNRMYFLQSAEAAPSPVIEVETPTTLPMPFDSGFIVGQELNLSSSTTVEIKVPYGEQPAEMFNLQIFPPGLKYGSRNIPGIQLTEGPDAWEIEFVVPTGQAGTWLLAAINDGEFSPPGPTLNAQVTTCQNSPGVTKYPVDGMCVELQTPPSPVPSNPDVLYQNGNVRIYSPLGFTDSCEDGTCTTVTQGGGGEMVMALIGYVGDEDNWVALKGGQFVIVNNVIQTTENARLIMARFTQDPPITLPVLRGQFEVNNATGVISSIGSDLYPLVKTPLPNGDVENGSWTYTIELSNAVMMVQGLLQRLIEPTESLGQTTFNFNAQWSITARGGQDLTGETTLANSPGEFNVGTLIVDPASVDAYWLEYNPADIQPGIPQAIPEFLHIRLAGATLKQPANTGGTQVPVQALILNPGKSVLDEDGQSVTLYCGTASTCFDLRGESDTMTPSKQVARGYRMPDLIIQDQAGTVMINTPEGVEIYSKDHPESQLRADDGYSFSYEAFGATIKTYQGVCPSPRDPLNPETILPGTGQITTVVEGSATLSVPNAESTSGGPEIGVTFTLCENSMREMGFIFSTGDETALPLGNSGLFMNLIRGRISLAPEQGPQPGHTTVTMEVGVRGMSPDSLTSNIFVLGMVTIDTRGLFDMQLQAGLKVVGGYGVGVDGHFWVAWAPLDLGFEVQACAPYTKGFDAVDWSGHRCTGNELLFGSLRAHIWQGQGWQHKYNWLPDNDDMHIAARYTVSINIATGMVVETAFVVIPPTDIQLFSFTMAFGEFCTNNACTSYEWGVTGAYTILGYDFGIYYGFDSGLDFILGSGDYLLIDEAGGSSSASSMSGDAAIADRSPYTVNIPPGTPSAMFTLGWDPGAAMVPMYLSMQSPSGTVIDQYTVDPAVTVTTTPTSRGSQTVIVIEDPQDGVWQVFIDGSTPLPPHTFLYVANKPEPTLQLADIPAVIHPGDVIDIEWVSNISEQDTAWLSLYYTTTNAIMPTDQEIVGPIVERIPLTPNGSYEWHVKDLAFVDNDYHIFARIDSDATAEINACGESYEYNPDPSSGEASCAMLNPKLVLPAALIPDLATFWYEDWEAPASPTLVGAQAVDWTSIMVLWEPNVEVDIAGYLVRCTQASEVRTARVPAQHMAGSNEYESAQVNGLRPYQTSTCSLRAYDTSGNVSGYSASVEIVPDVVISEATISPDNGATLTSVDDNITVVFPPGIVDGDTRIKLITRSLPPHPVDPLAFAGTGFNLSAYGPNGIPVNQFPGNFTVDVSYGDLGDTSASGGRAEEVNLYWWDGDTWQNLLPCEGCYHDTESQHFVVILDHLTEFAILAGEQQEPPDSWLQYLPLIMKY